MRVNYTDAHGISRRKEKIVYGLPEAKDAERRLAMQIGEAPLKMTVADLCALCLDTKRRELRESSYEDLEKKVRIHIVPTLGALHIDKLSAPDLQQWKNAIADTNLALTTKRNVYKVLSIVLNFGVRMGYLKENPLSKVGNFVDVNLESSNPDRIRYYTAEQFLQYIAVAKNDTGKSSRMGFYPFFAIAYYTGMRKGEINALKWSDIDGNVIKVRRSVNLKARSGVVETAVKRPASIRDIQMPLPLIAILEEHKQRQAALGRFSNNWRVCGGASFLPDTSIDKANRFYADTAGLPRISVHEFRHSHASLLCNSGINIKEIARRLGHANVDITWRTYSHLYPAEEERALQILNKIDLNLK